MVDGKGADSASWATYIRAARERLELGPTDFGKLVGVRRQTVFRWEKGENIPTEYDKIALIASAVGDDVAVALRAAGQEKASPQAPIRDEEIAAIWHSDAPLWLKETLIDHVKSQREADRKRRRDYVEGILKDAGRLKP